MEIVQERLEREYDLDLVTTVPSVEYKVYKTDGEMDLIENPSLMPAPAVIERVEEPYVKARIMAPKDYIGPLMTLGTERRGVYKNMTVPRPGARRVRLGVPARRDHPRLLRQDEDGVARVRLARLRDARLPRERPRAARHADQRRPDRRVLVIIHKDKAYEWGRKIADKLKELIPRQLFEVAIQAAIGQKVIARTTVKPLRKDVLAKCYGGDISRKRKLLEKQKEGKKRMKQVGAVEIPQEAFLAVLQVD
jgi:GTP-binding protein LepA